ncbi:MAG: type II secretion system protein [Candidatus Saccharibacteria bacterium]|jgi:prepilin-type N-terminal cleavage/methylation domain-containing protein|nr:type II secretion system protein [Candidatus Saccharibacteria bacterium]
MTNKNNKKGFTIIEVVLVLAIAGLIFLMVFIALPALQRSQRNTRRRQDMARILSAFNDYQTNNNGKMPKTNAEITRFVQSYVGAKTQEADQIGNSNPACDGEQFCDPDGTPYSIVEWKYGPSTGSTTTVYGVNAVFGKAGAEHEIKYYINAKCSEEENTIEGGHGEREIAILYMLEGNSVYCGDNQ